MPNLADHIAETVRTPEQLIRVLRELAESYPEDVFPTPPLSRQAIDAAAAHVLRRMAVPWYLEAARVLEELTGELRLARAKLDAKGIA